MSKKLRKYILPLCIFLRGVYRLLPAHSCKVQLCYAPITRFEKSECAGFDPNISLAILNKPFLQGTKETGNHSIYSEESDVEDGRQRGGTCLSFHIGFIHLLNAALHFGSSGSENLSIQSYYY
ncbi:hypothetical protein [Dyadobacter arcticus]|uniref:Secreted protein n=1 Tax=Dyadobacter arcticus TaxID=1078754 RepID=A0ABX0UNB5_9BACT|nr:hypothetical protein [Dyadobacter arcticus]NIJ54481.1 hypothetical protein [Dyadobacter arcticus]